MDYPIKTLQQLRPILLGFRKQAGMSQAAVAALLGVTQQSYAKIEANPAATSVARLFTIFRLLGSEVVLTHRTEVGVEEPAAAYVPASLPQEASASPKPARKSKQTRHTAPAKMSPPSNTKEPW